MEMRDRKELVEELNRGVFYTHNGRFHADDVLAAALLSMWSSKIKVRRVDREISDFIGDGVLFDFGEGRYDHHRGAARTRLNGVPYAASGLIWADYGPLIVEKVASLHKVDLPPYSYLNIVNLVDKHLIQWVDAIDNGENPVNYGIRPKFTGIEFILSINTPVESMHRSDMDRGFAMAVHTLCPIIEQMIVSYLETERAQKAGKDIVIRAISSSKDSILVIDEPCLWKSMYQKSARYDNFYFAVVKCRDHRWSVEACPIPDSAYNPSIIERRFPYEWRGLTAQAIKARTSYPILHYNNDKSIAICSTKEDALIVARRCVYKHLERIRSCNNN